MAFRGFNIFHQPRTPRQIKREAKNPGLQPTWERRELPGAGAQQYAFETYGIPQYPVFGNSGGFVEKPLRETSPGSYQLQTAPLVGNPPSGVFQGQFMTQPLMDPNTSLSLGITAPGSVPPAAYNLIPAASPTVAP